MKPKAPEAQFMFKAVIGESLVGPLMAFMDGKAEIGIHLIKQLPNEKNTPRGSLKSSIQELLAKNGMKLEDLKAALRELGFTSSTVHTQVGRFIREKHLQKSRGFVRLGRKPF